MADIAISLAHIADALESTIKIEEMKLLPTYYTYGEPKWIPCSERLPEEDYETGNGVQFSADVLATIVDHKNDGELYVWLLKTVDGKWYDYIPNEDGSQEVPYLCEVIAWMPLPEPYKDGEEE